MNQWFVINPKTFPSGFNSGKTICFKATSVVALFVSRTLLLRGQLVREKKMKLGWQPHSQKLSSGDVAIPTIFSQPVGYIHSRRQGK